MYNVHIEMPLGNRSKGYDFEDQKLAMAAFERMCSQVRSWVKPGEDFVYTIVVAKDDRFVIGDRIATVLS